MKGIILACIIDKITTLKDRSVKITLDTQELSPSKAGEIFTLMNSLATVYISPSEITSREMAQVKRIYITSKAVAGRHLKIALAFFLAPFALGTLICVLSYLAL